MKTGPGLFLKALLPLVLVITVSAGEPIKSTVYEWSKLKMIRISTGSSADILKGPTRSLEMFHIKAVTLKSGKAIPGYLIEKGCDELIIIKEGTAEITINNEAKQLGVGSVAVASAGDNVVLKNSQKEPMTYYSMLFKPRQPAKGSSPAAGNVPHLFKDWTTLEFMPSANGGRRDIMRQPTSSFRELEIHTTTLKEGLPSHNSHTHPDEEIILIRFGTVEETINGKPYTLGPGSVIFLTDDDDHGIRNAGAGQCEYYAIRWLINDAGQKFVHPGINQTSADLNYMKSLVLKGEQPWKDAFDRLKNRTDLKFIAVPHEHVMRGPYGKPNIGGNDLSRSATAAYDCALLWYFTGNRDYANKAIEIINAWSPVLRDFDYNDAKLLAGWTGHSLCNAAEILRYTDSEWEKGDIDKFTNMLMTVYYPLLRYYFPQANGNWDGAIIHSILAIGIFTDNREIFNNGINHFLYSPVNGSIFKYVYPSGQCQESLRDQGHVQLGLGEFAGAAQVAYTQGVDLFAAGNNRIALGFEYTAGFLLGHKPQCYGPISERAKNLSDIYENVYRHYASKGVDLPFTKIAADSVRRRADRNILTAIRIPAGVSPVKGQVPAPNPTAYPAGAGVTSPSGFPQNPLFLYPGQPIQKALDSLAGSGKWIVLKEGVHIIPATLKIPNGITLAGEGLKTIVILDKSADSRDIMVNSENDLHDVTIRDMVVEGALNPVPPSDPNSVRSYRGGYNRGGIIFRSSDGKQMKNLNLLNITVQNCTYNGVFISGASGVTITNCDFNESGSTVVPGPRLQHNLLLSYCEGVKVNDSRLDTSPNGCGIALDNCIDAEISGCEIARNGHYGILVSESSSVSINKNFVEANDKSGIMLEFLFRGSEKINVSDNIIQDNNGFGIESYAVKDLTLGKNTLTTNNSLTDQQKISSEKNIVLQ